MKPLFGIVFLVGTGVACGCAHETPCLPGPTSAASVFASSDEPYRGTGDPYLPGSLAVRSIQVERCQDEAPAALLLHVPDQPGTYAVLLYLHQFLGRNSDYDEVLRHVASHGFVVVVPQMVEPGLTPLLGRPTAAEEAELAANIIDWLPTHLDELTGIGARSDLLGLAGHSRGGKVAWLSLVHDPSRALAIAGVDPVDGTGGPFGNQPRVVQGAFPFSVPSLVIGTELGGVCAPDGDNHVQFYQAALSPAWHVVIANAGHGDMLDQDRAEFVNSVCPSGGNTDAVRRLTAGLLVAFFRGALQGDTASFETLTNVEAAPATIAVESR